MTRINLIVVLLASLAAPSKTQGAEFGDLRLRGRLQTRFEVERKEPGEDGWTSQFRINRARLDGRFKPADWIRLVLEAEGAEVIKLAGQEAYVFGLLDAYGRIKLKPWLSIQLGQFKKPFSRLKLMSSWDLWLPSRGLLNRYAVAENRHGGFGGRGIGVMLSGRFKKLARLEYAIGAFSGPGVFEGEEESHKDFVSRLELRPLKGLSLAASLSHKLYHTRWGHSRSANLFGVDAAYQYEGFGLLLEAALGDNLRAGPGHHLWGAHATLTYSFKLWQDMVLTPAAMLELFDPDDAIEEGTTLRMAFALNLDMLAWIRLVAFIEGATRSFEAWDESDLRFESRSTPIRFMLQANLSF